MTTILPTTSSTRPTGVAGQIAFETDSGKLIVHDGTHWRTYNNDGLSGWSGSNTYSLNFDGADDYLTTSTVVTPTATSGTISAWIKISNSGGLSIFCWTSLATYPTAQGTFRTDLRVSAGKLQYFYQQQHSGSVIHGVTGDTTINDNVWHHVAVTSDGSAWSLYVDGAPETLTVSGSNSGNWAGDLYAVSETLLDTCDIGAARRGSNIGVSHYYTGNIDELAVWDSALSSSQITNIYKGESNGGSGGNPLGEPGNLISFNPKAWWRMGDGAEANSGTTVYDMSAFSNDMTLVNATSGSNTTGAVYQPDTK